MRDVFTLFNDLMLVKFREGNFFGEGLVTACALDFEVPLSMFRKGDSFNMFGAADEN